MNKRRFMARGRIPVAYVSVFLTTCYHPPHERTPEWDLAPGQKRPDRATAHQGTAEDMPASPEAFSPDPGIAPTPERPSSIVQVTREVITTDETPLPPTRFNPDPGGEVETMRIAPDENDGTDSSPDGGGAPRSGENNDELAEDDFFRIRPGSIDDPFFNRDAGTPERKRGPRFVPDIPQDMLLPRLGVEQHRIEAEIVEGRDPGERYRPGIDAPYQLPRDDVRFEERIYEHWHAGHYEHAEDPENFSSVEDRWRIATGVWDRYLEDSIAETPYERPTPYLWHPYFQSTLKGDIPVIGQDIFASLTLQNFTDVEFRDLPTPSAVSTARPRSYEFFGKSGQAFVNSNTGLTFDLFRGETAFKPVEWLFRVQPVFNVNYISARETTLVSPDPRGLNQFTGQPPGNNFGANPGGVNPSDIDGLLDPILFPAGGDFYRSVATERLENYVGFQQLFFETHLLDLSENYDFAALRIGTQTFNADFRGHVFIDSNWGYRLFGNLLKNRLQYNIAWFDMFEKESFSELNSWHDRDQNVFIANVYWQDFLTKGYTAQLSFLANWDKGSRSGLSYDSAGNIVRPTPIGTVAPHDLDAYYLGWSGEGHIGRLNISHSLYHVFGEDELNGIAGRAVDISAWMAALELSVDTDWMRHKLTFFYASGDDDPNDGKATGWDSIIDAPNFIGGPFSYWQRQGPNLGGTAVFLNQRLSLLPNLRSNKFLGQSNFVNPGIFIAGIGEEWELTPKTRFFANLNYLMFVDTSSISSALVAGDIDREIGWDLSFGVEYRPFLTDNLKLAAGIGMLFTGDGFKDIYNGTPAVAGFAPGSSEGVDDVLYSGFVSATMTF